MRWVVAMKRLNILGLALCFGISPMVAMSATIDASKPMMCSALQIAECEPANECVEGEAENVNLPEMFLVNVRQKTITDATIDGEGRGTQILNIQQVDDRIILQGVENGRGWTVSVSKTTGKTTLTSAGDALGFVAFGICTQQW